VTKPTHQSIHPNSQAVVHQLLEHGADPNREDGVESCALLEACKCGHDEIIATLVASGGRLGATPRIAARLCQAVSSNDLPLLARLLQAGADPCAADYVRALA
jgi:ankyrin repeat protein